MGSWMLFWLSRSPSFACERRSLSPCLLCGHDAASSSGSRSNWHPRKPATRDPRSPASRTNPDGERIAHQLAMAGKNGQDELMEALL